MSRSEQERREQEARRARRLAERAEQRAQRKAEQARRAAERAEKLAERARHRPSRDQAESFEDKVDAFAEKWERKAESWLEETFEFGGAAGGSEELDDDLYGDYGDGSEAGSGDEDRARRQARASRDARAAERERRRRRRERRRQRHRGRTFSSRFRSGRGLYRDKEQGKICGVCAGTAEYLDLETWHVRLVAVMGLIFVPSFVIPAYFIAYFLMDDKPYYRRVTDRYPEDEDGGTPEAEEMKDSRRQAAASGQPDVNNAEAFRQAKQKFSDIEDRLRAMESHVTSSRFELQRELKKISGDDG